VSEPLESKTSTYSKYDMNHIYLISSGVTRGLSQGVQNVVEGVPLAIVRGAEEATLKIKLRNDSESEYRGCLYQLQTNENTLENKKKQPNETQKSTKYQNVS